MYKIKMFIKKTIIKKKIKEGLELGDGCIFSGFPDFGTEPYLIRIGKNVNFSGKITFLTHDGSIHVFKNEEKYENVIKFGRIEIGDNCFIGHSVIILPGVKIGQNTIVGAGAVVTKNVPDNSVVAGVPARVVSSLEDYAERCFENTPHYNIDNYKRNKKEELQKIL